MPQSMASASSGSPGSEMTDRAASCLRAATLAASAPAGSRSAAASSSRAVASPWSEPAAATHSVCEPWAGTVTL